MRKTVLALILISAFLILGFSDTNKKKVIFFGDSITYNGTSWEGAFINLIEKYANESSIDIYEFIASGVPGDRVTNLYLRVDEDIISQKPDIVVLYVGSNDIWHKELSRTGTDFATFGKFYAKLVEKLRSNGIHVILVTPAVIGEKTDFSNPCDDDLKLYCDWIREFAEKKELPLVDLRKAFLAYNLEHNPENKEKGILTADGGHMRPEGSKLIADEIWKVLKPIITE